MLSWTIHNKMWTSSITHEIVLVKLATAMVIGALLQTIDEIKHTTSKNYKYSIWSIEEMATKHVEGSWYSQVMTSLSNNGLEIEILQSFDIIRLSKLMNRTRFCCDTYGSSIPTRIKINQGASPLKDGLLQWSFMNFSDDDELSFSGTKLNGV